MTITEPTVAPAAERLAAARLMLSSLGITVDDLTSAPKTTKNVPTFDDYIPIVEAAVTPGTLRVYGSYWKRIKERWGERRLDEPRSQSPQTPPAALQTRRGPPAKQINELVGVASSTGNDPALDALIVRFHLETAARRAAALKLRLMDIDEEQCLLLLQEKGGVFRWQPASPTLIAHLLDHAKRPGSREPRTAQPQRQPHHNTAIRRAVGPSPQKPALGRPPPMKPASACGWSETGCAR